MTDHDLPGYLEVVDVCKRYGSPTRPRSRSWIYTSVANGELPAPIKIGGKILFSRAMLAARDAERLAQAERETQERLASREVAR